VPTESYGFINKQLAWETIAPLLDRASPLRTAHLRDPVGPQIQFASESFIDEIAAAIGADPVAFRLRYLKAPRDIAVVKATAERAGWEPRPSPWPDRTGDTLTGRGIAYAQRSGAVVAIIAEAPEAVDIMLLNRPELPPAGTGESSIRPVAAAIANAVFDATAVRLRRAPLTPERLRPELA
jgi:CO/xanthine dehydrogenase Mo-binding subunit